MTKRVRRAGMVAVVLAVSFGLRTQVIAVPNIIGAIDIPSDGSNVLANEFYAAGWVFRCDTGAFPEAISVAFFNRDTGQWFFPSSWTLNEHVYRPDVRAALKDWCPNVGDYTGYHVYPDPPPPGHWDMYIAWATSDGGQWTDRRQVTIVQAEPSIIGSVDIPSDGSDVLYGDLYAAGWVFRCDTGAFPEAIGLAFFNRDTGQWFFPSSWILNEYGYRPDVRAALKDWCPNVGDYTGYHVYPDPPPPGHWDMYISWATHDGGQWTDRREVTIVQNWAPYRWGSTSRQPGTTVR